MRISIIVAIDKDNAIGADNKLLYWLPNDLKRFKALTTGNTIIMGRKTFDSLPKGALPGRRNIVISRNSELKLPGVDVFNSLQQAIDDCRIANKEGRLFAEEVFIIGGASIYQQAIPLADRLCITLVNAHSKNADTFFPKIDHKQWSIDSYEFYPADEKHEFSYKFIDLLKKRNPE